MERDDKMTLNLIPSSERNKSKKGKRKRERERKRVREMKACRNE
jgi:hypothetical protein